MAMWRLDCRVQSMAHSGVGRPVKRRLQMATMVAWTSVIMAERRSCQTLDTFWRQSQQGLLMNWVKNMGEREESRWLSAAWPEQLEGWRWPNVIHREQADNKGIMESDSPSFNNASVESWEHKDDSPSMWVVNTPSAQWLSRVWLFETPWIAARQASLSITNSWSSLRLTSIKSMMPSSHLILCRPLLLLPPIPPSIRVSSNESTLRMRWPKYWTCSFSIIPSKEIPGMISFRTDWLDLLAVQGTLKSLLQQHSSKASILRHSVLLHQIN